jgi:hypothetical protein
VQQSPQARAERNKTSGPLNASGPHGSGLPWSSARLAPAAANAAASAAASTEIVYRRELRPVITTGAEIMDQLFTGT